MTTAAPTTAYQVQPSTFRHRVTRQRGARFEAEADRYHLYVMVGCPWAHRTLIVRALKGLEQAIPITAVHHRLQPDVGWVFPDGKPEPLYGATHLRDLYRKADPAYSGRITVPVLWDRREATIVNNESSEIVRMLGRVFDDFAGRPSLDLYPAPLRPRIDAWNARLQWAVNEGAYRAGFATSRHDHDAAARTFFAMLAELDAHLGESRYLVGDEPTEADWRLFPALIRFEWVYHDLFELNERRLLDHPNVLGYTRELYQWPGIADTVDAYRIRDGYFGSMRQLNPSGEVPQRTHVDFTAAHGREAIGFRSNA